jgi:hypothetical protein
MSHLLLTVKPPIITFQRSFESSVKHSRANTSQDEPKISFQSSRNFKPSHQSEISKVFQRDFVYVSPRRPKSQSSVKLRPRLPDMQKSIDKLKEEINKLSRRVHSSTTYPPTRSPNPTLRISRVASVYRGYTSQSRSIRRRPKQQSVRMSLLDVIGYN